VSSIAVIQTTERPSASLQHLASRLAEGLSLPCLTLTIRNAKDAQQGDAAPGACPRRIDVVVDAPLDYFGRATALAGAIKRENCSLVLCGHDASSQGDAAVGQAVAELLDWQHLSGVLSIDVSDDKLKVSRRGCHQQEVLAFANPIVLCLNLADAEADEAGTAPAETETIEVHSLVPDAELLEERQRLAEHLAKVTKPDAAELFSDANELLARLHSDGLLKRQ
jgi:hypothetical protein